MKKIKVWFVDFWELFNPKDNFILDILKKEFIVQVTEHNPDFVFASCCDDGVPFNPVAYDSVRIAYMGENIVPDFNLFDYGIGFHYIDFGDRYLRYPLYLFYKGALERAMKKHQMTKEEWEKRKHFCATVVSNPRGKERNEFFEVLSNYKKVASGGKWNNNVGHPVKDKLHFLEKFRFSFAFENCSTPGYVTEKILESFGAGNIPVYWGDPEVAREFNPKAFINCHDYNSFDEVVEKIKWLEKHPEEEWKMIKEPIFVEGSLGLKHLENDSQELEEFILNICRQEKADAYRINRGSVGNDHLMRMKRIRKLMRLKLTPFGKFVMNVRCRIRKS